MSVDVKINDLHKILIWHRELRGREGGRTRVRAREGLQIENNETVMLKILAYWAQKIYFLICSPPPLNKNISNFMVI